MNWNQFKDPVSYMCLSYWGCGSILVSNTRGGWVVDSSPLTVMTNIFVTEFSEFSENIDDSNYSACVCRPTVTGAIFTDHQLEKHRSVIIRVRCAQVHTNYNLNFKHFQTGNVMITNHYGPDFTLTSKNITWWLVILNPLSLNDSLCETSQI